MFVPLGTSGGQYRSGEVRNTESSVKNSGREYSFGESHLYRSPCVSPREGIATLAAFLVGMNHLFRHRRRGK
jgi:hypothetical protein